ncbi:uromodulin-like isoform X2 [Hemicordylus capensis]|uniref:uromodulin-like isoform X2 n=1 Tax=Hemicordylus capensis TaxID=884348 RepID=UPI002304B6C7|nr:uromodulin-like isoform X2 [Hemicordylus capensis]
MAWEGHLNGTSGPPGEGALLRPRRSLGPCLPSPCFHQGVCRIVENNATCTCKPGFIGTFCQEMVVKLQCEEEYMEMMVRKEVFEMFKIPLALVHLKNSNCKVSEQQADGASFWGAKLTGDNHTTCGSVIKVNGSHVSYANVIESDRDDQGGVITRSILTRVHFSCIYAYKRVVGLLYPVRAMDKLVQFAVKEGDFTVTMALYESETFEQAHRQQTFLVTDTLYVLLQIEGQDQVKYFFLSVDDCWGTPVADPDHATRHTLIMKGCPHHDQTVTFLNAIGTSTMAKFSFQMFQFKNFTEVFLHCQVRLCIPDNHEPCAKQCPRRQIRKRELEDDYRKIVSYGPIQLLAPSALEARHTGLSKEQQSLWGLQVWISGAVALAAVAAAFALTAAVKAMKK